jgi:hypothetical protein
MAISQPPASATRPGRAIYGNSNCSALVFLLPFIEQDALSKQYQALVQQYSNATGANRRNWNHADMRPINQTPVKTDLKKSSWGGRKAESVAISYR